MRSPFKFLDAYSIRDKDVFFGREKEVDALYQMVFKTQLTLLYGLSGTGKTSIIQCGLANRFDGPDWLPFYIRREQNINRSLRKNLIDALDEPKNTELPNLVSALFEDYLRPVFLIFDQFEELFILGSPEEKASFANDIRNLLKLKLPCRIILVIREEYLGQLYPLEKEIPTIFDYRLRIEPMNNTRVHEVIEKSFNKFNIILEAPEKALRQSIIDNVSSGKSGVQLPYLQIYLDMLYRDGFQRIYNNEKKGEELPPLTFSNQDIQSFGEIDNVLDKFISQQTELLQQKLSRQYPGIPVNIVRQVLDAFVTEDGTKRPIPLEFNEGELKPESSFQPLFPEISFTLLTSCLRLLEQSRLLRITDNSSELAHDSLAYLIDQKRTEQQRQLIEVKKRITATHLEKEKTGVWPTERQLISMEEFIPKIRLEPYLAKFIEESVERVELEKEKLEQEQQRKLEEAIQRTKKEKALREKAETNEKRARGRFRLALLVSIIALVFLITAVYFWIQSNSQRQALEKANIEINTKRAEAENARQAAIEKQIEAEEARDSLSILYQRYLDEQKLRENAESDQITAREKAELVKIFARIDRLPKVEIQRGIVELQGYLENDKFPNSRGDIIRKIEELKNK